MGIGFSAVRVSSDEDNMRAEARIVEIIMALRI
jgi:hypothetical protein